MNGIEIEVYVDHKLHGLRQWSAVPRIGDTMVVSIADNLEYLKVTDVIWEITKVAVYCETNDRR